MSEAAAWRWRTLAFVLIAIALAGVAAAFQGCAQARLENGKNAASYKGVKIFSPTVLTLRTGACGVPSVDAAGIVTEPAQAAPAGTAATAPAVPACDVSVMTVNGVDTKSFINMILTAVLSGIAAG